MSKWVHKSGCPIMSCGSYIETIMKLEIPNSFLEFQQATTFEFFMKLCTLG